MPEQTPEAVWMVRHPSGILLLSTTELSEDLCIEAFRTVTHFRWEDAAADGYTCCQYRLVPVDGEKDA